jgi:hypothetical protein
MKAAQIENYNKNNISVKIVDLDIPFVGERSTCKSIGGRCKSA